MPIKIAVRVSYPETGQYDWHDALAQYVDVGGVEVTFYRVEAFLEKVEYLPDYHEHLLPDAL